MRLRPLRLLCLGAALTLGSGCFVLEELDKGMEIMEAHSPAENKKKQSPSEGPGGAGEAEEPPTYRQAVSSWFEGAKTLSRSPGEDAGDDPMVSCHHGGRRFFARRSDCLARGGEPG